MERKRREIKINIIPAKQYLSLPSFHSIPISFLLDCIARARDREREGIKNRPPILKFQRNRISLEIPMVRLRMKIIEPFRLNLYILFVKRSIGCYKQIRKLNIDPYLFSRVFSSRFIGKQSEEKETHEANIHFSTNRANQMK